MLGDTLNGSHNLLQKDSDLKIFETTSKNEA